jgi:putative membrane protein
MLSVSDRLAVTRTELANERTLLAYARTALALAAGGLGLVGFSTERTLVLTGWALLPVGAVVLLLGIQRFHRTRRIVAAIQAPAAHAASE